MVLSIDGLREVVQCTEAMCELVVNKLHHLALSGRNLAIVSPPAWGFSDTRSILVSQFLDFRFLSCH